ncbi:hypothetical protein F0562_016044 [Nyssa sinensis]|uniref:Glutaredoxin domain-containing protein n=1 Tax=Nyssa sinensis TaxID=561372 RepID=A0A5J4ZIS8_9ASTE|nr:hypothetical protein F0562_016044 [Nyssa sinensis]
MGCASSKLFRKELKQEIAFGNGGHANHVVSLTSSTYGVLNLDKEQHQQQQQQPIREINVMESKRSPPREEPEVINAWELMGDLEDEAPVSVRKSPKSRVFLRGFADIDARSPLKFFNQMSSPKKLKRFGGKENKGRLNYSPKQVFKVCNSPENSWKVTPILRMSGKGSPIDVKCNGSRVDSVASSRRRSLGPLFDPELVASFEKELSEEEQIKKIVSATPTTRKPRNSRHSDSTILESFEKNCPPGGENAVIVYTTTLRGIRKTFEDCNNVRSIIESHDIQMFERDVSMDSGFKEELRGLMGTKGASCDGCAGVRFIMCLDCNGSCKVLDEDGKKKVRCGFWLIFGSCFFL